MINGLLQVGCVIGRFMEIKDNVRHLKNNIYELKKQHGGGHSDQFSNEALVRKIQ